MIASLERVLEGIVATLRTDVIPKVTEEHARSQAVGVIDLINNLVARVEWARDPLLHGVRERREALGAAHALLLGPPAIRSASLEIPLAEANSRALLAERDRLDAEIADLLVFAYASAPDGEAVTVLRKQIHDDMISEMAMSRKPLFAEMTKGGARVRDGGS